MAFERTLPQGLDIRITDSWDGDAAKQRIFDLTESDGTVNYNEARRFFGLSNPDDAGNRGAHKFPVAVPNSDGEPVVDSSAVSAALSSLNDEGNPPTDTSQEQVNDLREVLSRYSERAKEMEGQRAHHTDDEEEKRVTVTGEVHQSEIILSVLKNAGIVTDEIILKALDEELAHTKPFTGITDAKLPDIVKERNDDYKATWVAVYNDTFDSCVNDGSSEGDCESRAFANAYAVANRQAKSNEVTMATFTPEQKATMWEMIKQGVQHFTSDIFDGVVHDFDNIKMHKSGKIEGYLIKFTDSDNPDLEGDFFTKATDFGIVEGDIMPVDFHHGTDKDVASIPVGHVKATFKEDGLYVKGQLWLDNFDEDEFIKRILNERAEYEAMVKERGFETVRKYAGTVAKSLLTIAEQKALGWSSEAIPSSVKRVSHGKANHIAQWTTIKAGLTHTPAEPTNDAFAKSIETFNTTPNEVHMKDEEQHEMKDVATEQETAPPAPVTEEPVAEETKEASFATLEDVEAVIDMMAARMDAMEARMEEMMMEGRAATDEPAQPAKSAGRPRAARLASWEAKLARKTVDAADVKLTDEQKEEYAPQVLKEEKSLLGFGFSAKGKG